jgi:CHAD domain-containing protein
MTPTHANPASLALAAAVRFARSALRKAELNDDCVHALRKSLKSARAAVRLLRPGLSGTDYRRANLACRDVGHYLSPLRDAHVLLRALDRFAAGDGAGLRAIADTRRLLESERDQHHAELDTPAIRGRCASLLESGCDPVLAPAVRALDPDVLHKGLHRQYRRARRAFEIAQREGDGEHLHEWRKQTKYLRNGADLLTDAGARGLKRLSKHAERIADQLGEEHDLAVLERSLRARGGDIDAPELIARLAQRRRSLQARALRRGEKVFAQRPQEFSAAVKLPKAWRGS